MSFVFNVYLVSERTTITDIVRWAKKLIWKTTSLELVLSYMAGAVQVSSKHWPIKKKIWQILLYFWILHGHEFPQKYTWKGPLKISIISKWNSMPIDTIS